MTYEMPIVPKPGEVFLYVCLSEVKNMTVAETLTLLQEMGYSPELRYRQSKEDGKVSLYALLKHEQHAADFFIDSDHDSDHMADEWEALVMRIEPDLAVRCPHGVPRREPIAA